LLDATASAGEAETNGDPVDPGTGERWITGDAWKRGELEKKLYNYIP